MQRTSSSKPPRRQKASSQRQPRSSRCTTGAYNAFLPDTDARRPEEAIYISPGSDRVTVVFSTVFKDETDRIFGRVFLQEFVDARRLPAIQAAPQVLYSNREPPREIRHLPGLSSAEEVGYVTFGAWRALESS